MATKRIAQKGLVHGTVADWRETVVGTALLGTASEEFVVCAPPYAFKIKEAVYAQEVVPGGTPIVTLNAAGTGISSGLATDGVGAFGTGPFVLSDPNTIFAAGTVISAAQTGCTGTAPGNVAITLDIARID